MILEGYGLETGGRSFLSINVGGSMQIPKFNPGELQVVAEVPDFFGGPGIPIYNFPVTGKEAVRALYERNAIWQVMLGIGVESRNFTPAIDPDNVARAFVFDGTVVPGVSNLNGGKDLFGIEWEYIPTAGGSMVRPGKPFIEDANDIEKKVVWPDIDSWDWDGALKANEQYLSGSTAYGAMLMNGYFERLISFMDFEGAVLAMIDEDQKGAVKRFFEKLSDLYIRMIDKFIAYFPQVDIYTIHDDWGSQKDTFFAPAVVTEMIVPSMQRVTDFIHSKGRYTDLHCCGNNIKQVANMIAAGFDSWTPQAMNDIEKIYDLYGDRILIATMPEIYDAKNSTEEEQRAYARAYAEKYCRPEKPSSLSMYSMAGLGILTNAFREELYKQSRINYGS
jgi:hypothetical protein